MTSAASARVGLAAATVGVLIAAGCARTSARPVVPPAAPPRPAAAPAAPRGVEAEAGAPTATTAPKPPDPSEEMTAEELATIPEPVPGNRAAPPAAAARAPGDPSPGPAGHDGGADPPAPADHYPDGPAEAKEGDSVQVAEGEGVWRVQVFATPDRALADRVSKEASARLGAPGLIERDASLYKVRLGGFASEAEAQALRDRAVRGGYPGAFRVRSTAPVRHNR